MRSTRKTFRGQDSGGSMVGLRPLLAPSCLLGFLLRSFEALVLQLLCFQIRDDLLGTGNNPAVGCYLLSIFCADNADGTTPLLPGKSPKLDSTVLYQVFTWHRRASKASRIPRKEYRWRQSIAILTGGNAPCADGPGVTTPPRFSCFPPTDARYVSFVVRSTRV